jgi:hypothetical protein
VRLLSWLTLAIASIPLLQFLLIAFSRLTYPFDIEWMEGAVLGHGIELVKTGSIYRLPSQEFVSFIYPPLYTYITAFGLRLFGVAFTFARLVSILSVLGSALLIGVLIWRESQNRVLAALAFLLPFAAYGVTGHWFDLVRVDGLALILLVGAVFALLYAPKRRALNIILGAVLLALAAFGKQSFLLFGLATAIHLALGRKWRDLAVYAGASAVIHALLWGGLYLGEGRLAFTYIFEVPRTHGWWKKSFVAAFSQAIRNLYTFRPVLIALAVSVFAGACGCLAGCRKDRLSLLGLFALTAVGVSLLTRAKWGGYENAFIPTYFFLSLLAFYSVGVILRGGGGVSAEEVAGRPPESRHWASVFLTTVLLTVMISSITGALSIDVRSQRVTGRHRFAARQLAALAEAAEGQVLIPSRNAAVLTGRVEDNHYHFMAARDLSPDANLFPLFERDNHAGLESGRYPVIIMDTISPQMESRYGYQRITLDEFGIQSGFLGSMTGKGTVPRYLYYREGVDLRKLYDAVRGVRPNTTNK